MIFLLLPSNIEHYERCAKAANCNKQKKENEVSSNVFASWISNTRPSSLTADQSPSVSIDVDANIDPLDLQDDNLRAV